MARPTTKEDLLRQANEQYKKLWVMIETMPEEVEFADFNFDEDKLGKEAHWKRDKNIRDVLIHLYEWHQLLLNWINANSNGEEKPFLPSPYNWKTYGEMNVSFWEKHQKTSYETSKNMLMESHEKVIKIIETFTNDELFAKGVFNWTGTSTLGSYCVSATASHYEWAMKKLKKHIKTFN